MDENKFLELQFLTLRAEIEKAKDNMFKLAIGGGAAVPAAQYIADTYSIGMIILALPLVVVVLVLLFIAENRSMMRAGTYILKVIEPRIQGVMGWETWLSTSTVTNGTRIVDKLVILAFSIIASGYFVLAVVMAASYAYTEFGENGKYLTFAAYCSVGAILAYIIYSLGSTDTD